MSLNSCCRGPRWDVQEKQPTWREACPRSQHWVGKPRETGVRTRPQRLLLFTGYFLPPTPGIWGSPTREEDISPAGTARWAHVYALSSRSTPVAYASCRLVLNEKRAQCRGGAGRPSTGSSLDAQGPISFLGTHYFPSRRPLVRRDL